LALQASGLARQSDFVPDYKKIVFSEEEEEESVHVARRSPVSTLLVPPLEAVI
jgi:hypothetical protein